MRLATIVLCTLASTSIAAQEIDPDLFADLTYRHIGPVGNRVSAVTGVPGDPNIYYIGAASGGVWKTDRRWGQLGSGV